MRRDETAWSSPLVVAIFTAAAAGLVNIAVAAFNGWQERSLAEQRADAERILEAIKTGEPEKAARNLQFLVETGLISDPRRAEKMQTYLASREPAKVAALPAQAPQFTFERSSSLTPELEGRLTEKLLKFNEYLQSLGFSKVPERVNVVLEQMDNPNAYYELATETLHVDSRITDEIGVFFQTYSDAILFKVRGETAQYDQSGDSECLMIGAALADYFTASYVNDPRIGVSLAKLLERFSFSDRKGYLRNLKNSKTVGELPGLRDPHSLGEVLGGAFWDMREKFGPKSVDSALAKAWLQTKCDAKMLSAFQRNLSNVISGEVGPEAADTVATLISQRGFSVGGL